MHAAPQPGSSIHGRVLDALGGEALARVRVELAQTGAERTTDSAGAFHFDGLAPGDYTIQVSTVGYRMLRRSFPLAAGESKEFEVVLSPESLRHTETVEVTSGPFDVPRHDSPSEITLSPSEVKNLGSVLADDPLRAVQAMPGVTSNNDFDSRFSMRGASYQRIGLYFDDVLLHTPFHLVPGDTTGGSMTVFNGDMIETMSLHSGAFPSRFADRSGGILDVQTREGSRNRLSFRGAASASNASVMAEGPLGRRGSWLASARKSYLQYILRRTAPDFSMAFGFTDVQAKLAYDVSSKHRLTLSVVDGFSGLDRSHDKARLGVNSIMTSDYHSTLANVAWRFTPSNQLILTARGAWMRERAYARNPSELELGAEAYGEWIGSLQGTWVWGESSPLDFGWSVRRLRDDGFNYRYQFNPFLIRPLDQFRGTAVRSGGFAQQSKTLGAGKVTLVAGLRLDYLDANQRFTASPNASAAWRPFRATTLQVGWGQYVQHPAISELYSIFGNRFLLPLLSQQVEAALEQRLDERTRLRVQFYNRADRDMLFRPWFEPRILDGKIFNPPANDPIQVSQRGWARGMEVFLQRRTANGLTGWVSYSYGRTGIRDGVAQIHFPSDFDQRHNVTVFGSYRLRPTVNLSARFAYGSALPVPGFFRQDGKLYYLHSARNRLRDDTYKRADFRINKAWSFNRLRVTLYGEVVNLFNTHNYFFESFNGYNSRTAEARLSFTRMFPILPSAGVMVEF